MGFRYDYEFEELMTSEFGEGICFNGSAVIIPDDECFVVDSITLGGVKMDYHIFEGDVRNMIFAMVSKAIEADENLMLEVAYAHEEWKKPDPDVLRDEMIDRHMREKGEWN